MDRPEFPINEEDFNRWLVDKYFKYGSVDEVMRKYRFSLPISYASYQRVLDRWGVIKKAGPNNKLNEAIDFITHLAKDNIPFEMLYKKIPPTFQTSATTLYRILGYVKEGLTRRVGVGLIITPYNKRSKVLVANDFSAPRIKLGKSYGAISIPMGYARKRDSRKTNILRILQHEVFVKEVVKRTFPYEILEENLDPFMYLDIADVRVAIYHLQLGKKLSSLKNFSSYKLKDFQYLSCNKIIKDDHKLKLRAGVKEAVLGYKKYLALLNRNLSVNPFQIKAHLNQELEVVFEYES